MRWNVIWYLRALRNVCSAFALRQISVYISVILGHERVSVKGVHEMGGSNWCLHSREGGRN